MGTINRIKKVRVKRGTRKELARLFEVSKTTVSLAASGINNSDLAQKIRNEAVEMGGDPIYLKYFTNK
jgi:transcriptional regulator with XRE-family HTH domain